MKPFTQPTILFWSLITCLPVFGQVRYSNIGSAPFPQLIPGITNNQFLAGDFDSDKDIDLVFWNGSLDQYLKNDGTGSFSLINNTSLTPFKGIRMPVFGLHNTVMQDFDADGDLDILYFNDQLNWHTYLENTGNAFIQTSNPFANFVVGNDVLAATVNQFFPGDFDQDGDVDMLYSTGKVNKYYKNNGNGLFTHYDDLTQSPFANVPSKALPTFGLQFAIKADFDADGDIDIYDFNPWTGEHFYLLNNTGIFALAPNPFPNIIDGVNGGSGTANRFQAGDFDADGDVDMVFWTPQVNQYYRNDGDGLFQFFPNYMGTPFEGVNGPSYGLHQSQLMDLDQDGDIDILTNEGPVYSLLIQKGAPPVLQKIDPAPGALNVPIDKNIVLQFSDVVTTGPGKIHIHKRPSNMVTETIVANTAQVTGSGTNTITIDPILFLDHASAYNIQFDQDAFRDAQLRILGKLDLELRRIVKLNTSDYVFTTITTRSSVVTIPFVVFPNPVRSGEQLSIQSSIKEGKMRILSINGAVMKQTNWKTGEKISTNGLANGLYIVELTAYGKTERMKVFVN